MPWDLRMVWHELTYLQHMHDVLIYNFCELSYRILELFLHVLCCAVLYCRPIVRLASDDNCRFSGLLLVRSCLHVLSRNKVLFPCMNISGLESGTQGVSWLSSLWWWCAYSAFIPEFQLRSGFKWSKRCYDFTTRKFFPSCLHRRMRALIICSQYEHTSVIYACLVRIF